MTPLDWTMGGLLVIAYGHNLTVDKIYPPPYPQVSIVWEQCLAWYYFLPHLSIQRIFLLHTELILFL